MRIKIFYLAMGMMVFTPAHAFDGNDEIKDMLHQARVLLNKNSVQENAVGESILMSMTGRSVEARYLLGWWLLKEKDVGMDERKRGLSLISSACFEGNKRAGYLMANVYKRGGDIYTSKNDKKAVALLRKILLSDDSPSPDGESMLAKWLLEEDPINNKKEAIYWLERSVNHKSDFAVLTLAPLYMQGAEKDVIKAWFYSDLGGTAMASEKHDIEKQMTPEQLEQAQEMSWRWQDEHHIHVPGYRGQGSPIRWRVEGH